MTLRLTWDVYAKIRAHLENAYPEEGAGFLLGQEQGKVRFIEHILPQSNEFNAAERRRRYLIDAREMLEAEDAADELGLEILGIFHSHPDHPPEPSSFDLEWSLPWFSYLITSVVNGAAISSRCWRLNHDRSGFDEERLDGIQITDLENQGVSK
jgi:proteasome lid subunit RPN8/RPN11